MYSHGDMLNARFLFRQSSSEILVSASSSLQIESFKYGLEGQQVRTIVR